MSLKFIYPVFSGKIQSLMNKIILFLLFEFLSLSAIAQNDANAILQKSLQAGSQINNGTYNARLRMKYLMRNDTTVLEGSCRFHRLSSDTLKGARFELAADNTRILYDGRKKITIYAKDSLA